MTGLAVFAFATEGGRHTREVRPLVEAIDRLAAATGLGWSEIRVAGHRQTDDRDVFEALKLANVHSLLGFNAQAARERIERLPWVRSATIQRSFPDAISVTIAERLAFAIWEHAGRRVLIDDSGRLLGPAPAAEAELPVVSGEGAAAAAGQLMAVIGDHPQIRKRMAVAHRIEDRRWSLILDAGLVVYLPADGQEEALWRLTMPRAGGPLVDRGVAAIDLRSPTHVVITPTAIPPMAGLSALGRGVATGGTRSGGPETRSE